MAKYLWAITTLLLLQAHCLENSSKDVLHSSNSHDMRDWNFNL
jgi:hypothetical protein